MVEANGNGEFVDFMRLISVFCRLSARFFLLLSAYLAYLGQLPLLALGYKNLPPCCPQFFRVDY